MKKILFGIAIAISSSLFIPVKADFGDADFPEGMFDDGPKSYHDVWCRKIKNECRVRFQGPAMWVEGQGGIQSSQYVRYRYDKDGKVGFWSSTEEHYNYITYKSTNGKEREALFLITNTNAQSEFLRAFFRWKKQKSLPIPNYRLPNSQGPQETHDRDEGLNPYDNPPINDWSIKTTEKGMKGKINCDSPVWKNRKECQ